ncbi:MAG: hypothetical protein U5L72_13735 [Bacteroidales bacterium]|nr:hypothetical protein [Bacteroidales bacterium]
MALLFWYSDSECGSLAGFAADRYIPAMSNGNTPHIIESQAQPLGFVNIAVRYPVELIEDVINVITGDANPVVGNRDLKVAGVNRCINSLSGSLSQYLTALVRRLLIMVVK